MKRLKIASDCIAVNSHIRRLDEELNDSKALVSSLENDLESAQNRLHTIEEQYANLQLDNNKLRAEIDTSNRQIDVLKVRLSFLLIKFWI